MSTGTGASDLLHAEDHGVDQIVAGNAPVAARSPLQLFWRRFRKDKVALAAATFIILLFITAILAGPIRKLVGAPPPNDVKIQPRPGNQVPLDTVFRDESGEGVVLGDYFAGKPVILVLAYFRCPRLCTEVLNDLSKGLRGVRPFSKLEEHDRLDGAWNLDLPMGSDNVPLLVDRDGGLWFGTVEQGIGRIARPEHRKVEAETFARRDGLSGDGITAIFEDRDGGVWLSTYGGVDRFRFSRFIAPSTSAPDAFPALLPQPDGALRFAGLQRELREVSALGTVRRIAALRVTCAYRDADGWIYLAGRTADWMRVDGENMAAGPIERVLLRLREVSHVAVYAVPDEHVGDQVMTAVVLNSGATLSPKQFEDFLAAQQKAHNVGYKAPTKA